VSQLLTHEEVEDAFWKGFRIDDKHKSRY
jgi:hypothetical protein